MESVLNQQNFLIMDRMRIGFQVGNEAREKDQMEFEDDRSQDLVGLEDDAKIHGDLVVGQGLDQGREEERHQEMEALEWDQVLREF